MPQINEEFQLTMITMTRARVVVNNSCKLDYARCKLIGKMHERHAGERERGGGKEIVHWMFHERIH